MKKVLTILLTVLMIVSCEQQPTLLPTATFEATATKNIATLTPRPSQTFSPTLTPSPSLTEPPSITPTGTLTEWIETYPTKQPLVISGTADNTWYSDLFTNVGPFYFNPGFILYPDGQLILGPGNYEKQLSQKEIDEILIKLEQLGFFQVENTFPADDKNPIYTFPKGVAPTLFGTFAVDSIEVYGQKSNAIGYMAQWENYLNQPTKDIASYLENFSTEGTTPYQADRLLVSIRGENEIQLENEKAIPWPKDITQPTNLPDSDLIYMEGAEAQEFYNFYRTAGGDVFSFEGHKFQAVVRPLYPHECHTLHYHLIDKQFYFFCDDP